MTTYKLKFINQTTHPDLSPQKLSRFLKGQRFPTYLDDYLTIPLGLILKVEKT